MMKFRHHLLHSSFVGYLPPRRPSRVSSSNNPAVHWFLSSATLGLLSSHFVSLSSCFLWWIRWYVSSFNAFQLFVGYSLPHRPSRVPSFNNPAVHWFLVSAALGLLSSPFVSSSFLFSGVWRIMWHIPLFNAFQCCRLFIASLTIEGAFF